MEVPLKNRNISLVIFTSLCILVYFSANVAPVFGQTDTGSINGTVSDSTGAVVPNAKVTVRNVATGFERLSATDDRGFYNAGGLPAGMYSVTVEAANLAKKELRAEVTVGGRVEANVTLTIGVTSTVIEVVGEGGVNVNTETATIGTVIDSQQIQQLPTLNRNPYTFAQYVGTASDGDPSGRGVGVSFNGLRSSGTNVLLNGAANNDEFTAMVGQTVPLDSVQEYSVLTNNFTAEFGRATSAVVNLVTKNGTNEFHGSAYEYNRVSALATQSFYDKAVGNPKSHYTRNQFGGALGGPIKKEKLFFFGNAEWNRIRSEANSTDYVVDPSFISTYAAPSVQSFYQQLGTFRPGLRIQPRTGHRLRSGHLLFGKPDKQKHRQHNCVQQSEWLLHMHRRDQSGAHGRAISGPSLVRSAGRCRRGQSRESGSGGGKRAVEHQR